VKIYLLLIDRERCFFYSDDSEVRDEPAAGVDAAGRKRSGIQGWLHRQLVKFKSAWQQAESGFTSWLRRVWEWLHSWSHPDEWMLARLRSAHKIELHHPVSRSSDEVRAIWQDYLAQQGRRHLVWLSVNTVIAPFSVLLWILPGPNVIGYWFAYRAIHHLLVVWGIRRVRQRTIRIELHPVSALDVPVERDEAGKARHSALDGAAELLDEHVAWMETSQPRPAANRGCTPQ
jgi:Mitochondrial K+-H+ exchange-related